MTRRYYRPIKDETIISTLHYMRQHIGREGLPGMEHVEALLEQWGVDPDTLTSPRKRPKLFAKGELRRLVLDALREGPQTGRQIADKVEAARPDLPEGHAYKRVYICLWGLKKRRLVRNAGGVWLAP